MAAGRPIVKPLRVLALVWGFAGIGAVAGSIVGNVAGRAGLFTGAIVGGSGAIWLAVRLAAKVRWLPPDDVRGATVGGIVGFLTAAPIAVGNLHTPVIPIVVTSLAGVGALLGPGLLRAGGASRDK